MAGESKPREDVLQDSGKAADSRSVAKKPRGEVRGPRSTGDSQPANDPFIRAENEDDDGYDPYSDRRPAAEPLFERDPWD